MEEIWEGLVGGRRKGLRGIPGSFKELLKGEGGMNGISGKSFEEHGQSCTDLCLGEVRDL